MISVRDRIIQLIEESGESLSEISRLVGRNHSYFQQYIRYGKPSHLPEQVRYRLAEHFQIDERLLREPELAVPPPQSLESSARAADRGREFIHQKSLSGPGSSDRARLMAIFQTLEALYRREGKAISPTDLLTQALDEFERQKKSFLSL